MVFQWPLPTRRPDRIAGLAGGERANAARLKKPGTFETLHRHQGELDRNQVLPDVVIIADEADRQLEEAVGGFMVARGAAA